MKLNKPRAEEYLKGVNFGLGNKAKTENKYKGYKVEKIKLFLEENKNDIENYLLWLDDNLRAKIEEKLSFMNYYKLNEKRFIRMFKTLVNGLTFNLNYEFIGNLETLNKNENRVFTIKFYLAYYDDINAIMKEVLNDYVLNYCENALVKRLVNA